MAWSPRAMPDLHGAVALVTGGNSGIGFHTCRVLAANGARVVLACRDLERGKAAIDRIHASYAAANLELVELDLADMSSVRGLGEHWSGPLDLLINNAGVMAPPQRGMTVDGFELQFGTNHLGHFVLTGLLLPSLLRARAPRVVTVTSIAHLNGRPDVVDGNAGEAYQPNRAYANSKLANVLFALELQRRSAARHLPLTSTAAHPGAAATGLFFDQEGMGASKLVRTLGPALVHVFTQSAAKGAKAVLYAAAAADPGTVSGPLRFAQTRGAVGRSRISTLARDEKLARRLWHVSEDLTGFRFPWPSAASRDS